MTHSRSPLVKGEPDGEQPDPGIGVAAEAVPAPVAGADDTGTDDAGMSTVEYAVGTVAAAAFAAVLYRIVTGDSVVSGLTRLINDAFSSL